MITIKIKKLFSLLVCSVFFLTDAAVYSMALVPSSQTIYRGIDVSVYQEEIDFTAVRSDGIDLVYIRAGAGNDYVDPNFERNYTSATAAGLGVGFYYYMTATSTDEAAAQANLFAGLIDDKEYAIRPAMDYESFFGLGSAAVNQIGLTFLQELERLTNVRPVIYSDSYRTRTLWEEPFGIYPLWVADYDGGVNPPDSDVWDTWTGFQFSDEGRISGISGNVDLDRFTPQVFTDESSAPAPIPPATIYYTVRRGDTLSEIAQRFGTTVSAIVAANNIRNPNLIFPGEVFLIPSSGTGGGSGSGTISYTVRRGDTLSEIAQRFGSTVSAIVAANNIRNPNLIFPGEVFTIPIG